MGLETTLPKISIVTPSYNQGKYLEKTILSVLEQGYPNLEYIIVDGGSTDESVEIIKKYQDRLAWWVSEPDRGQSHAINKGFERATGEIFGWLNSDDWYHPGALQAVADAFAANPGAGAVVGAGEMVDEDGRQLLVKSPEKVDLDFLHHWLNDFFWQPSCFFTKRVWEECGPLDEKLHYAMDLDLWLKIAGKYRFVLTGKLLSVNLKHESAKTTEYDYLSIVDAIFVILSHGGEKVTREALQSYVKTVREFQDRQYREMEAAQVQLSDAYRRLTELNQQLAVTISTLELTSSTLEQYRSAVLERDRRISELYNSVSWRVTKPLRWVADRLAGKL